MLIVSYHRCSPAKSVLGEVLEVNVKMGKSREG